MTTQYPCGIQILSKESHVHIAVINSDGEIISWQAQPYFTLADLSKIAQTASAHKVRSYLTMNTEVFDNETDVDQ